MKKNIIVILALVVLTCTQCSLFDKADQPVALKGILENNVAKINSALDDISSTPAYQFITAGDVTEKSDVGYNDSITLDLIEGVYVFQPDTLFHCRHDNSYRLFRKSGESDSLIVKLPSKFVFHPRQMHYYSGSEPLLKNNFTIAASDYHYYYTFWSKYDYKLKAALTVDSTDIGILSVLAMGDSFFDQSCSSEYVFPEGYEISSGFESGDTSTYEFTLRDESDLLLGETIVFIKGEYEHDDGNDFERDGKPHEWIYTLSIGNIDLKKSSGVDSIEVYLDGVLQQTAAAVIVDSTGSDGSICHHRDILLTFDDGSTATLSELLDPALTQLKELVDSLRSMSFAKRIVDYIAFNIYYSQDGHY